jgi:nitroreductase
MPGSSFVDNLEWRRAVKKFAPGAVDSGPVLEAIRAAPSSFGLQPYKVVCVKSAELRAKLQPACYGQPQVTSCAELLVFCARTDVEARAEEYLRATGAESMRGMLMGFLAGLPEKAAWAARQAYIALGFGLAAAAEARIASCPMEGFVPAQVGELLELPANLQPVVLLALGQRSEEGEPYPRFRFPAEDIFLEKA